MSIRLPLLALLVVGSRSAAQLHARLAAFCDREDISRTLTGLLDACLIEEDDSAAGTYRLTADGRAAAERWFSAPVPLPDSGRTELVLQVALAVLLPEVDLLALLDRQRRATLAELRQVNLEARGLTATRTAERLRLERRIYDLEAEIRWLDRVEALDTPSSPEV